MSPLEKASQIVYIFLLSLAYFAAAECGAESAKSSSCVRSCGSLAETQLKLTDLVHHDRPSVHLFCGKAGRRLRRLQGCVESCPDGVSRRAALHALDNGGYHEYCQRYKHVLLENSGCLKRVLSAAKRRCSQRFCLAEALKRAKAQPGNLDVAVQMCSHRLCHFGYVQGLLEDAAFNCTREAPLPILSKLANNVRSFLHTHESMSGDCGDGQTKQNAVVKYEAPLECRQIFQAEKLLISSSSPSVVPSIVLLALSLAFAALQSSPALL